MAGFTLVELLIVLALVALLAAVLLPMWNSLSSSLRLDLAAHEMVSTLRLARTYATQRSVNVAVKFYPAGTGGRRLSAFALFRDNDADGVSNADIVAGIDTLVMPERRLQHMGERVRFGFPSVGPLRDPAGAPLTRLWDPIRFNRSDLASFGPIGTSTPGSLYITDGQKLVVVRVSNRTGKVRVLRYDADRRIWK